MPMSSAFFSRLFQYVVYFLSSRTEMRIRVERVERSVARDIDIDRSKFAESIVTFYTGQATDKRLLYSRCHVSWELAETRR